MSIDGPSDHNARRAAGKGAPGADDPGSRGRSSSAESGRSRAMTDGRVAEIRKFMRAGGYNSLKVVDVVARRMLASGDLKW